LNALGYQLMLDLKGCDKTLLDDLLYIKECMLEAASEIGATVVGETFHQFSPQGVTGVISIAESHLSIHTWPEHGYAAIDIFTCGTVVKPHKAAQKLMRSLNCRDRSVTEMRRGIVINSVVNPKVD